MLTARVQTPGVRYPRLVSVADVLPERAGADRALPGVEQAAGVTFLPMARGGGMRTGYWRSDRPLPAPGQGPTTDVRPVTPGVLQDDGHPQVAGRDFTAADQTDSPRVPIISEAAARREFPGEDPIGKRIDVFIGDAGPPYEIVGVVKDIKIASLDVRVFPMVYIPHRAAGAGVMTFVIRTSGDPQSLATGVAAAVH